MPKYRNIHTKMPDSEDINDMPDDFTRLFYVMFFIILDREGRGYDKPAWLKSKAFPLREDVTVDMISAAMDWFEERGMIFRYEAGGKKCFFDPKFIPHQSGLNRESPSVIPAPTQEQVASWSGVTQEQVANYSAPNTTTTTTSNTATNTNTKTATDSPAHEKLASNQQVKLVGDPKNPPEPFPEPVILSESPVGLQAEKLWNSALGLIQKEMPKADFDAYIRPLKLGNLVGNQLKILAMNTPTRDWVRKRAGPQLQNALKGFAGCEIKLLIESDVQEMEQTGI
jgi:hypothetical protein